jgi:hypothetical protein
VIVLLGGQLVHSRSIERDDETDEGEEEEDGEEGPEES